MIRILTLLLVLSIFSMCTDEKIKTELDGTTTSAIVKDLTSLDGCRFVFQLSDGKNLVPFIAIACETPPLPKDYVKDPLTDFQLVDGMEVMITYRAATNFTTACMAGELVRITAISEIEQN